MAVFSRREAERIRDKAKKLIDKGFSERKTASVLAGKTGYNEHTLRKVIRNRTYCQRSTIGSAPDL